MLAFEGQALELAHLPRERGLVKRVLDVEAESFPGGYQIRGILRQFRVRISIKHQKNLLLMRRAVCHEQQFAETLGTPSDFIVHLRRNFL